MQINKRLGPCWNVKCENQFSHLVCQMDKAVHGILDTFGKKKQLFCFVFEMRACYVCNLGQPWTLILFSHFLSALIYRHVTLPSFWVLFYLVLCFHPEKEFVSAKASGGTRVDCCGQCLHASSVCARKHTVSMLLLFLSSGLEMQQVRPCSCCVSALTLSWVSCLIRTFVVRGIYLFFEITFLYVT